MKCLLLMSVDLIGSTAYKAARESKMEPWSPAFESFFENFPHKLEMSGRSVLRTANTLLRSTDQKPFKVWKFVGDEILLELEVDKPSNIAWGLRSLLRAVKEYEIELSAQTDKQLALKATAWLANFPVPNAEVIVPQKDPDGHEFRVRDYLGPGVDLGFRLAQSADDRRIPVSASLAQVLSTLNETRITGNELHLGFSGRKTMKGVIRNKPYPVFWLDRSEVSQTTEDALQNQELRVDSAKALDFLDEFFNGDGSTEPVWMPNSGADCRFSQPTEKLESLHEKYVNDDPDPSYQAAVESVPTADADAEEHTLESPNIQFSPNDT